MGSKIGQQSISFSRQPVIASVASIVGPMEGKGPLAKTFDWVLEDMLFGEKTWEKAEYKMLQESAKLALSKKSLQTKDVDYFLAGDLLNQITSANFAARGIGVPFFGLFGACSTFVEAMLLGCIIIDGGFGERVLVAASSHHNTAERQYRFPTEQGIQRPLTAQWTVTGSGAVLLESTGEGPRITMGTVGKVIDMGVTDVNNMGAAMAPAVADTLLTHFQDTGRSPEDYDLILTGDLGAVGQAALIELLKQRGFSSAGNLQDCGMLIYSEEQDAHAGGSGCGCAAVVFSGLIVRQLWEKKYHKILFMATGALMSPTSSQQGESIPGICHAVVVEF